MLGEDLNVIFVYHRLYIFFPQKLLQRNKGMHNSLSPGYLPRTDRGCLSDGHKNCFQLSWLSYFNRCTDNLETYEPLKYFVVTNLNKDQDTTNTRALQPSNITEVSTVFLIYQLYLCGMSAT